MYKFYSNLVHWSLWISSNWLHYYCNCWRKSMCWFEWMFWKWKMFKWSLSLQSILHERRLFNLYAFSKHYFFDPIFFFFFYFKKDAPPMSLSRTYSNNTLASDTWLYYRLTLNSTNTLRFSVNQYTSGDVDLYVKQNGIPTKTSYDYREIGTMSTFNLDIATPAATT